MSNLSVSQRFRAPCDDGKERVTCAMCGVEHETWTELAGNRAEDPMVARRGCACLMCRGVTKICPLCVNKLKAVEEAVKDIKYHGEDSFSGDLIEFINGLDV